MKRAILILSMIFMLAAGRALAQGGPAYPYNTSLTCTPSTGTVTGYNFYRATNTTSCGPFTKLNASPVTSCAYVDPNPPQGNYCYDATAVDGGQESGPSNVDLVSIPPPPPTSLGATVADVKGKEDVTVAWVNPTGTQQNDLYMGSKSGGPYNRRHFHFDSATSKFQFGPVAAGTFYFVATDTDKNGQSGLSVQAKVTVP